MPILKATTEKRVFADAQYAISQNDFINSKIGASEINVEKERQIKAITEYENVRSNCTVCCCNWRFCRIPKSFRKNKL